MDALTRLYKKIRILPGKDACWLWIGARASKSYGRFWINGKVRPALTASMILHGKGEPPSGTIGCHTCDNPPCVNPEHGFYGTPKQNTDDAKSKGRFNFANGLLTPKQVMSIFKSKGTQQEIATRFGIDQSTVSSIRNGQTWAYLTGAESRKPGYARKLTSEIVKQIRLSNESNRELGRRFGVSHAMIGYVKRGHSWAKD